MGNNLDTTKNRENIKFYLNILDGNSVEYKANYIESFKVFREILFDYSDYLLLRDKWYRIEEDATSQLKEIAKSAFKQIENRLNLTEKQLKQIDDIEKLQDYFKFHLDILKIHNNDFFRLIDGKRWILEIYKEYYWKYIDWDLEIDEANRVFQKRPLEERMKLHNTLARGSKKNLSLPKSEIKKLAGYIPSTVTIVNYNIISVIIEKILRDALDILNLRKPRIQTRFSKLTPSQIIGKQNEIIKEKKKLIKIELSFLEDFVKDSSYTFLEIMNKHLDTTITEKFFNLYTRRNQIEVINLLHIYQPDQWFKFYLTVREKQEYKFTYIYEVEMKNRDTTFNHYIWEFFKEKHEELINLFPDKNPDKFREQKEAIAVIKELLLELRDGDEVQLTKAIEIIRKEGEYSFITDGFIEETLKQVANKSPVFEYVRLKECIRTKGSSIETLGVDLDTIFDDWLSDIEEGKDLCMICMRPVTGEKVIGTCVYCGNKAHLEHFKEWVNQKAVCPACKKTLKQEDIIEITPKRVI